MSLNIFLKNSKKCFQKRNKQTNLVLIFLSHSLIVVMIILLSVLLAFPENGLVKMQRSELSLLESRSVIVAILQYISKFF